MSTYLQTGKRWRYDFTLNGKRCTQAGFTTKREAQKAEANRKEEVLKPPQCVETQTDTGFLELVNKRLDIIKVYNSERYYTNHLYLAKRWVRQWGKLSCQEITTDVIQQFLIRRSEISPHTANTELRSLRALFNYGIKQKWLKENPTVGIDFFPVQRTIKYIPLAVDLSKVLLVADADTQDYLYCIRETMARVGEINQLLWSDVDFEKRYIVLYTRKKKGGHRTPRKVPMTDRLYGLLQSRFKNRDEGKPWVFWHKHWCRKTNAWLEGPYKDRKGIMRSLCSKAGVRYFRFHALRHMGASLLDNANVNIGSIQRILGHENRSTTEIYLQSIGESEREAMRIFEQVSEKSLTPTLTPEIKKAPSDVLSA